jgi:hypothetical protein
MSFSDLVAAALLLGLAALVMFTWYRCHLRLRAKGYGRFVIALSFFLSLTAAFWLLSRFDNAVLPVLGAPVMWMLFAIVTARVLPTRAGGRAASLARRRSGRRRAFMPTALGWLATIVGGAASLFFLWQLAFPTIVPRDEGWPALLAMLATTLIVSQYWFKAAARATSAPVTLEPTETSVLYLRAFEEEKRPFAVGPVSVLKNYTNQLSAYHLPSRGDPNIKLTLEDFLEEAITAQIGPFVALGNPHDRLSPDGAVREYAPDDTWQQRFLHLARSATCIFVSVGGSTNLQWELEQIKQQGLAHKLCLFTSPRVPGSDTGILKRLRGVRKKFDTALAATWTSSTEALRRAGYECDTSCPAAGTAVVFDEHGKGTVLTTDATSPVEFIMPVADWFKSGLRSGKCVPVKCRSCTALTHVTTDGAAGEALCYACRQ